tara:strand:+ start:47897 stop:48052 length:156 start_codon:yes stop_codon:yes gene_type:complete
MKLPYVSLTRGINKRAFALSTPISIRQDALFVGKNGRNKISAFSAAILRQF